jgi:predicted DNA-binding protein (UPF0251 family)
VAAVTSPVESPVPADPPRAAGTGPILTPRECVALTAHALGLTQEHAARQLGTSPRTLRRATASAVEKLGARALIHAVALAVADGRLPEDELRRGTLPPWPARGPRDRRDAADFRRERFAELRRAQVPVVEAGALIGVGRVSAIRFEQYRVGRVFAAEP